MMYKLIRQSFYSCSLVFLFVAFGCITSCVSVKKTVYFHDIPDSIGSQTPIIKNNNAVYSDPKIETNDVLSITVQTIEQNNTNTPITTSTLGSFSVLNGYLVDKNGYIELSLIGFVKVAGLTTSEAREVVKQKAKEFYKEPVVNLRIANFEILVLGDVVKPGIVSIPNEKGSILDALALTGDLNTTAKRKNILLVRTEGETKKYVRLDITSSKIFESPYFYLKQRDVIYVEPNKFKRESSDQTFTRNLGILSTLISVFSLIYILKR